MEKLITTFVIVCDQCKRDIAEDTYQIHIDIVDEIRVSVINNDAPTGDFDNNIYSNNLDFCSEQCMVHYFIGK